MLKPLYLSDRGGISTVGGRGVLDAVGLVLSGIMPILVYEFIMFCMTGARISMERMGWFRSGFMIIISATIKR